MGFEGEVGVVGVVNICCVEPVLCLAPKSDHKSDLR